MAIRSLRTKILLLALLNLTLLAALVLFPMRGKFESIWMGPIHERVMAVTHELALELDEAEPEQRTALLGKYRAKLGIDLYLFNNNGTQLGGPAVVLPSQVYQKLVEGPREGMRPPPDDGPPGDGRRPRMDQPPPPPGRRRGPPPDGGPPPRPLRAGGGVPNNMFLAEGGSPNFYWIGSRIPIRSARSEEDDEPAIRGTLILATDSLWSHGFFLSFAPALGFVFAALAISALCWLPLIHGLTNSVRQMQKATGQIASGHFDVNVSESRSDEIGALGTSINQMASKLKGMVEGQKLFLAGVAHELRSPLARMELEVELLGRGASQGQQQQLTDLREDVEHLRGLVDELLLFTKSSMRGEPLPLVAVDVAEVIERAVALEAVSPFQVRVEVSDELQALGDVDYLFRAVANLLRNAFRYAGSDGPVTVTAKRQGNTIHVVVADQGMGVPENALEEIFKPFYRLETARDRKSGGTGLGLAIVRSAIDAMKGTVKARNLKPNGFAVEISLRAAR